MENEAEAVKLADELISCRLPDKTEEPLFDIVNQSQRHKHTKSCLKYNGHCRYGFPKLPSPKTIVAKPLELTHPNMKEAEKDELKARVTEVLGAAKKLLEDPNFDENMSIEQFCTEIKTNVNEYLKLLSISNRGKVLILKRQCNERYLNNYNPEMITAWNGNMDIQLVVDPYAVISYIASYMNKGETQTTPFLRETLRANAGKTTKEKLKALKETYLTHRQVGASEAAYKVLPSLKLKNSNISCVFVVTGFPKNRSTFFKRVRENDDSEGVNEQDEDAEYESDDDTEEVGQLKSKRCKIEGKEGTYEEAITIIDRYIARPKYLKSMCLAQFAISYISASRVPKRITFDIDGCSNEYSNQSVFITSENLPRYISLESFGLGKMRLRSVPAVMRIHSSKKKEGHEQQYAELLLYTAWENEKELHAESAKECIKTYHDNINEIQENKEIIYPGEGTTDLLENLDLEVQKPQHIFDMLDGQREQEQDDDLEIGDVDDPHFESFAYTGNLAQENKVNYETSKYRKIWMPSQDEINFLTRRLVPEQLNILRKVEGYCKDIIKSNGNLSHVVEPLRIIVHGGAGKEI